VQASRDLAVAVVANAGHDAADEATIELRKALLERYRDEPKPRAAKGSAAQHRRVPPDQQAGSGR